MKGGTGDDLLTGGDAVDVFVFRAGDGRDLITDFHVDRDRIEIAGRAVDFADATIRDRGADTVVTFADVTIVLKGVDAAQVTEADFLFV